MFFFHTEKLVIHSINDFDVKNKNSYISRTPNFQAWFWKKKTPEKHSRKNKVGRLFVDVYLRRH